MNIKKLREYHFGWGLGEAKSKTHSQKEKEKEKEKEITQIRNPFTKNKKLPNKNKQETQIHSQNIQIYASSQSRLTQALYQTRYEQYFETLKFKKKSLQIRNPPTNNMLLPP